MDLRTCVLCTQKMRLLESCLISLVWVACSSHQPFVFSYEFLTCFRPTLLLTHLMLCLLHQFLVNMPPCLKLRYCTCLPHSTESIRSTEGHLNTALTKAEQPLHVSNRKYLLSPVLWVLFYFLYLPMSLLRTLALLFRCFGYVFQGISESLSVLLVRIKRFVFNCKSKSYLGDAVCQRPRLWWQLLIITFCCFKIYWLLVFLP